MGEEIRATKPLEDLKSQTSSHNALNELARLATFTMGGKKKTSSLQAEEEDVATILTQVADDCSESLTFAPYSPAQAEESAKALISDASAVKSEVAAAETSSTPKPLISSKDPSSPSENGLKGNSFATGRWTAEEHRLFVEGLETCGRDWRRLAQIITTRSFIQIRTHAQKYFKKLARVVAQTGQEVPQDLVSTASDGRNWTKSKLTKLAAVKDIDLMLSKSHNKKRASDECVTTKRAGSRSNKSARLLCEPPKPASHHLHQAYRALQQRLNMSGMHHPQHRPFSPTESFLGQHTHYSTSNHTSPSTSRASSPSNIYHQYMQPVYSPPPTGSITPGLTGLENICARQGLAGFNNFGESSAQQVDQSRLFQLQMQQAFLQQKAEMEQSAAMKLRQQLHLQQVLSGQQRSHEHMVALQQSIPIRSLGSTMTSSVQQTIAASRNPGFPTVPIY